MNIIVQKFGGTSVKNKECLENVCRIVTSEYDKGNSVVVVVSAQSGITDNLSKKASEITDIPSQRELSVILSSGEQITAALLCMYLEQKGKKAISYTGWQLPITTDSDYTNANVIDIDTKKVISKLKEKYIVVVTGFQGIDKENNITTLGRGGSDTTAVCLAHFLNASRCEIYTDVDGVYTKDPNTNKDVKKIECISYSDMLKMANTGAKVLHNKCVEYAQKHNVVIHVKSSFEKGKGTIVK